MGAMITGITWVPLYIICKSLMSCSHAWKMCAGNGVFFYLRLLISGSLAWKLHVYPTQTVYVCWTLILFLESLAPQTGFCLMHNHLHLAPGLKAGSHKLDPFLSRITEVWLESSTRETGTLSILDHWLESLTLQTGTLCNPGSWLHNVS